jgi:hypothetical protein
LIITVYSFIIFGTKLEVTLDGTNYVSVSFFFRTNFIRSGTGQADPEYPSAPSYYRTILT